MATGQQFNSKEELITEIKKRIFKNGQNLIDGEAVQKAFLDVVESLWGQGGDSDIIYNNSGPNFSVLTRLTPSKEVFSLIEITGIASIANNGVIDPFTIIPQNFGNYSFFDFEKLRSVIVSGSIDGYLSGLYTINFNKLISEGVAETIMLQGSSVGDTVVITNDDNNVGDAANPGFFVGTNSSTYSSSRDLPNLSSDITLGFSVLYGNSLALTIGSLNISILIKGQLI